MSTPRTAICLSCRTSLAEGELCDLGCQAGSLSHADLKQRELLVNGAWDRGEVRFSPVRDPVNYTALKVPLVLSVAGGVLNAIDLVGGTIGGVFVVVPWLLVPVLAGRSTRKLFTSQRSKELAKNSRHQGVVVASTGLRAPASTRNCVAYSIVLRHKETRSDTLADAYSQGFDVKLADGRLAHIPAGRIRLEGAEEMHFMPSAVDMTGWWREIDPYHAAHDPMPPYPHNQIREQVVVPGQSIILQNELRMTTRQHRGADYRDASANVLEPRGVPIIRVIPETLAPQRS